ncbi:unnamed protein product, partial [marine sediment metagenome]
ANSYAGTWYVDDDAPNDPGPGDPNVSDPNEDGSAAHPFDAIQDGIDAAADHDTVLVLDGTYTGVGNRDLDFWGKKITVRSQSGDPCKCVIDCQAAGRGFYFHRGEDPNSVVQEITIVNGEAPSVPVPDGGAIFCEDSSPTITGCAITGNHAAHDGGGIYLENSSAQILSCTISGNGAGGYGGGIFGACTPKRTIVWGNGSDLGVGDEWYGDGGCGVSHCCDDLGPGLDGFGSCVIYCSLGPNIEDDPRFLDPMPWADA